MTEVNNGLSESTGSGASGDESESSSQSVSYETHKRLLSEKKRRDEEVRSMEAKVRELEMREKLRIETEARQKEDWKTMLELKEQDLSDLKERYQGLESHVHQAVKKAAFVRALGGSFRDNYIKLIDFDSIPIDPTTGSVDELALNKYAEQFRKDFKEVITPQAVPGVSQAAPKAASSTRSKNDVFADFAKLMS